MEHGVDFRVFLQVLQALENADTSIRLRISGEPWIEFSTVMLLSESAMILQHGADRKLIVSIRNVVEFELSDEVMHLGANVRYEVIY